MKNKRSQPFLIRNFKWFSLLLLIGNLIFTYFIPDAIMHSDYTVIGFIPFLLIIFIIPFFVFTTLISFTKRMNASILAAVLSIPIVVPIFVFTTDHREKTELNSFGVWVKGIVVDRKQYKGKGPGPMHWLIKCRYTANNRTLETFYHDDLEDLHPIGDTIKIICSKRSPEIYSLDSEWKQ